MRTTELHLHPSKSEVGPLLTLYSRLPLPCFAPLDRVEIDNESITIKCHNRADQISIRRKRFRDGAGIRVSAITWIVEGRNDLTDTEPIVNRRLKMFTKKVAPLIVSTPS